MSARGSVLIFILVLSVLVIAAGQDQASLNASVDGERSLGEIVTKKQLTRNSCKACIQKACFRDDGGAQPDACIKSSDCVLARCKSLQCDSCTHARCYDKLVSSEVEERCALMGCNKASKYCMKKTCRKCKLYKCDSTLADPSKCLEIGCDKIQCTKNPCGKSDRLACEEAYCVRCRKEKCYLDNASNGKCKVCGVLPCDKVMCDVCKKNNCFGAPSEQCEIYGCDHIVCPENEDVCEQCKECRMAGKGDACTTCEECPGVNLTDEPCHRCKQCEKELGIESCFSQCEGCHAFRQQLNPCQRCKLCSLDSDRDCTGDCFGCDTYVDPCQSCKECIVFGLGEECHETCGGCPEYEERCSECTKCSTNPNHKAGHCARICAGCPVQETCDKCIMCVEKGIGDGKCTDLCHRCPKYVKKCAECEECQFSDNFGDVRDCINRCQGCLVVHPHCMMCHKCLKKGGDEKECGTYCEGCS